MEENIRALNHDSRIALVIVTEEERSEAR